MFLSQSRIVFVSVTCIGVEDALRRPRSALSAAFLYLLMKNLG